MNTKTHINILFQLLSVFIVCTLSSCSDNDENTIVTPAEIATSVTLNLPSDMLQRIYTDNTEATVLPLLKGESVQLQYIIEPENVTFNDVIWTSSNEKVATVDDNGLVTAISGDGTGYSIVEVKPNSMFSGSGINATLKIVVSNSLVAATSININSDADELYAGDNLQLKATISPSNATYQTVSWSSSDESVATIDMYGLVTAQATTEATTFVVITATALDGSGIKAQKELCIHQTVNPQSVSIAQEYAGYECAINEKSITLPFTTEPADCTTSLIEWTSSNTEIATVENGVVTFNQNGIFGEFTITATCPQTGQSSSIKMNLAAGLIRETFHNSNYYSWYNTGTSSHEWHDGYITITTGATNATKQRADIKCFESHTWMHASNYPIFAFRLDDVIDFDNITKRNINIDAVGTSTSGTQYKAIGNGNNKWGIKYKCSDGSHIFIYDLSKQACGTGGLMPTNEVVDFTTLQIKYADMEKAEESLQYNLYWVQTFKSVDELLKYVDSEGLTYELEENKL